MSGKLGIAGGLTRAFIGSALTPLFILAALAMGLLALVSLPREEEPQISVPMIDIHVTAQGLQAEDGVKLVTEPLETIVKAINGVDVGAVNGHARKRHFLGLVQGCLNRQVFLQRRHHDARRRSFFDD